MGVSEIGDGKLCISTIEHIEKGIHLFWIFYFPAATLLSHFSFLVNEFEAF